MGSVISNICCCKVFSKDSQGENSRLLSKKIEFRDLDEDDVFEE